MSLLKKIWRPLVAILFIFVLIKKGPIKIEQLQLVLGQPRIMFLGLTLFFLQSVLLSFRWKLFVDQFSFLKFGKAFKLTLVGQFFSFFIPGGVGGDVIKALELAKQHIASKSTALSTVIADRVLGLFSMILMSSIFLAIEYVLTADPNLNKYLSISGLLLVGITVGLAFSPFFLRKVDLLLNTKNSKLMVHLNKILQTFALTFSSFRNSRLMIKNFMLCLVIQLISIYFLFAVVQNLTAHPPPFFIFFALCCFGFLASAIPLTPAGIGVGQTAFYFLFSVYGASVAEASVTAVSVFQLFNLFFALFGGFFFSIKTQSTNPEVA